MKFYNLWVECYFDEALFSEVLRKVNLSFKIRHPVPGGKMRVLNKIMGCLSQNLLDRIAPGICILDYDPGKSTENLKCASIFKDMLLLAPSFEDPFCKIYSSKKFNFKVILVKPDVEKFFRKFGGKIENVDTKTCNIFKLKRIIEKNRETVKDIAAYFKKVLNF